MTGWTVGRFGVGWVGAGSSRVVCGDVSWVCYWGCVAARGRRKGSKRVELQLVCGQPFSEPVNVVAGVWVCFWHATAGFPWLFLAFRATLAPNI